MSLTYSDFNYYLIHKSEEDLSQSQNNSIYNNITPLLTHGLPPELTVIEEEADDAFVKLMEEESPCDFILIAEFSELEGPIPICTIPSDISIKSDINLNSLTLHLMSTDFQVNHGGTFKISEDTQVLKRNVFKDIHALMQYFTLYDIKARGFVRPFCFGYISRDYKKLEKRIQKFFKEFSRISKLLKKYNREWFTEELKKYLQVLSVAKERIINELKKEEELEKENPDKIIENGEKTNNNVKRKTENENSDSVTLNQIAHQITEIDSILDITLSADEIISFDQDSQDLIVHLASQSKLNSILTQIVNKHKISPFEDNLRNISLKIPLLHPLKIKGEPLRPLSILCQFGSLCLVINLLRTFIKFLPDVIYSEMEDLNEEFQRFINMQNADKNFETSISTVLNADGELESVVFNNKENQNIITKNDNFYLNTPGQGHGRGVGSVDIDIEVAAEAAQEAVEENYVKNHNSLLPEYENEIVQIFLKLTIYTFPASSIFNCSNFNGGSDTEENIENSHKRKKNKSGESTSESDVFYSTFDNPTGVSGTAGFPLLRNNSNVSSLANPTSVTSISSYSSDEEFSSPSRTSEKEKGEGKLLEVTKLSWWEYNKVHLSRFDPGYGLLKFFRRYHKIAHHILFSILIGRPLVLCGSEKYRISISKILTALYPIVPSYPEKKYKVLQWHKGILISAHLSPKNCVKLIGLCIPERLDIHDLINHKDKNSVTILDVEKKSILGPAYSGNFLKNFESTCQKHFYDDTSLLSFIGSIFENISSKIFMFKSLTLEKKESVGKIYKKLDLKVSDIEIVKHFADLISEPEDVIELF